ncbi:hypothetical protein M3Y99_01570200 [Aphelenchoides fujianensis]|nr:hypothetical protein M3Y99_01570200 [Aphelenchoides fujianensis]
MEAIVLKTREVTAELTDCVTRLSDNRAATIAFFGQLKATSRTLGQILRMVFDGEDEEIQRLLREIDALQLHVELNDRAVQQLSQDANNVLEKLGELAVDMRSSIESAEHKLPGLLAELETARQQIERMADGEEEIRNDCRVKIMEAEARTADVGQRFFQLQAEFEALKARNEELEAENKALREHAKENREQTLNTTRTLSENSTVTNTTTTHVAAAVHVPVAAELPAKDVKTAEYFVEVFEKIFKLSDQLVQLVKRLERPENIAEFHGRALAEARDLRELVHQALKVFQRAKVEPTTLGNNLTAEVAAELKRIYDTMKKVKQNAERAKSAANSRK